MTQLYNAAAMAPKLMSRMVFPTPPLSWMKANERPFSLLSGVLLRSFPGFYGLTGFSAAWSDCFVPTRSIRGKPVDFQTYPIHNFPFSVIINANRVAASR